MKNYALFAFCLFMAFIACNKPSDFGKELVSGNNIPFEQLDTFTLQAVSEPGDSVRMFVPGSASSTSGNSMAGNVEDPVFGNIQAKAFAQFAINKNYSGGLGNAVIDSVIWDVYYDSDTTNQYGDLSAPISLGVFRINENVNEKDTLYSTKEFSVDPSEVGSLDNFIPKYLPKDSSHLRFKLNSTFANYLATLPDTTFKNTLNLQSQFEGLSIQAKGTSQALVRLNFTNANNRLTVYFKPNGGAKDTTLSMLTNANCVRHTSFKHNYAGSRFQKSIDQPGTDSLLFVQSMGGPRIRITLPDMSFLKTDALNFAELELTVNAEFLNFNRPSQLWLFKKNDQGELNSIIDGSIALSNSLTTAFGGTPQEFVENGKSIYKYRFRIPKHLTDYIDGKEGNELYLSILNAASVPARVVLNGPNTKASPMKLKLIVSKVI